MSSARFHNENRHLVITNFAQTFHAETGLTMASCRNIIQDTNSIFHGFSYLIKHLLSLIDFVIPCQSFTIKGLTSSQRKNIYIELFHIGIEYTKTKNFNNNQDYTTSIRIDTTDFWSVLDFRIINHNSIYQHHINIFNAFYSHVNNLGTTDLGCIIVSMHDFMKFKRIFADAVRSYNQLQINNTINNNLHMPNQLSSYSVATTVSSNTNIKQQLADLIFDIRHDLTDAKYKEILEKIAVISP